MKSKVKEKVFALKKELSPSWLNKQLIKAYLKSPPKVQYALAKFGAKHALKKKKSDLEHILKH